MIAPSDFIQEAVYLRRLLELRGDHVMEDALAVLIDNGDISRHLKKANKIYLNRRDHLCALLERNLSEVIKFKKPEGGMAVWANFEERYQLDKVSIRAARQGLYISDGRSFDNSGFNYNSIRFGFASLNSNEMEQSVQIITRIL